MNEVTTGIVGILLAFALFLTGIELAFAMGLVGVLGFCYLVSVNAGLTMLGQDLFNVFGNYSFTVIPLFIFMGQIAFNAGIAKKLYDTGDKFVGHIPGGLAMATVVGATAFKAVCGSAPATAATFASVAVPEMDRYGYDKKLSTGIVASVGTLGILIPPSGVLVIFGIVTEQSIGKLFTAGILPGLMVSLFFMFIIYGWCRIDPSMGPKALRSGWRERMASLPEVLWVLVIFLVVIGGLMRGFFTPTEAGSVGAFSVLLLSVVKRDIRFKGFLKAVRESLRTACMVLMLIAGSTILGHFLAVTKIPIIAGDWVVQLPLNRNLIMVLICLIYLLGGSFIDDIAFMILATPIFYPIALKLGFDPLWFGMIIGVTLMVGVVIPPVAMNVFVVQNITGVPFGEIYKGVTPFLISLVLCGALLFVFPQIATFLPNLLMR
jgi:C4-dicarboxylate transporter DctM subunit